MTSPDHGATYMKPPFDGPLDSVSGQPEDGRMESRLSNLETRVFGIGLDVAVLKSTSATKSDLTELEARMHVEFAELRADVRTQGKELRLELQASIAQSQNKIILWVVSFIFLAQLLPILKDVIAGSFAL